MANVTKVLFSGELASCCPKDFAVKNMQGYSVHVITANVCLCNASMTCCDLSLQCDTFTEAAHGYATGLKGVLARVIGSAKATPAACFDTCCNQITEACHGFTEGEKGS